MKFKIGDKVRVVAGYDGSAGPQVRGGDTGVVVVDEDTFGVCDGAFCVLMDTEAGTWYFNEDELEPVASTDKPLRPLGDILLDMEPLLEEMTDGHDLQFGEILNLIRGWLEIHCPDAREEYVDGTVPTFFYGPKDEDVGE